MEEYIENRIEYLNDRVERIMKNIKTRDMYTQTVINYGKDLENIETQLEELRMLKTKEL